VSFDADDYTVTRQVIDYYHQRLKQSPAALEYLQRRGITAAAIEHFKIGYADRTLGLRLPEINRKSGAEMRQRLKKIGLWREETGHEHFSGSVVFPICDEHGCITEIYGRKICDKLRPGTAYHLYLPGPHIGIWNGEALRHFYEVILCESVIDALTFWCVGYQNVTCIYGTEGFTDELREAFITQKTQRVYLAYDSDKAGNRAAERDASWFLSKGIECYRVKFPAGMDANEYARKVTPPEKSLQVLLRSAEWLGRGKAPNPRTDASHPLFSQGQDAPVPSSLAAKLAASAEASAAKAANSGASEQQATAQPSAEKVPSALAAKEEKSAGEIETQGTDIVVNFDERSYRVRGLDKNNSLEVLKVNVRLMVNGLYYVNVVDLYQARQRQAYIDEAAKETLLDPEQIKRDLGKLLLALEQKQEERIHAALAPVVPTVTMSEAERAEALELLRDPRLIERVVNDFAITGERINKVSAYLGTVSRLLDRPLAIIIQSTSAAGKSSLMEAVLAMMPEEAKIKYSAMTGQSLYYLGETDLKHKILAIVEEEGAEKASYALKLLQSEGELTIASTVKDENGRLKTEEYHVEGPVMIFLTTTAVDIDEELLNRCIVLTVDESREQTEAIHHLQRQAETLEGLQKKLEHQRVLRVHRNAQRLLRPLHVINPYAPRLTFLSDRTRTRRDHVKYLTLIRTIALLHQYQREEKRLADGTPYIEATLADIAVANRLAHEVLGRSLDELPPQTRKLLGLLDAYVTRQCQEQKTEKQQCCFSRRQVREVTGWSNTQLKVHLDRLVDLEYLLPHRGCRGQSFLYELLFDGDVASHQPQLIGLIDLKNLGYDEKFTGLDGEFTGVTEEFTPQKRGQNGGVTGSKPNGKWVPKPNEPRVYRLHTSLAAKNRKHGGQRERAS
jgi:DNA primase